VTLKWKSPGASETHTASIYAEGDGRLHEQLFWIWNDVDVLSLCVNYVSDPGLHIEELAVFEGDASEPP
jgi:hypothetical protein